MCGRWSIRREASDNEIRPCIDPRRGKQGTAVHQRPSRLTRDGAAPQSQAYLGLQFLKV